MTVDKYMEEGICVGCDQCPIKCLNQHYCEYDGPEQIILSDTQKQYIWDHLNMSEVYVDTPNHKFANFETAKNGEWRLDKNNDNDYPWSLFVVVDYWDDLTQEFVNKILTEE